MDWIKNNIQIGKKPLLKFIDLRNQSILLIAIASAGTSANAGNDFTPKHQWTCENASYYASSITCDTTCNSQILDAIRSHCRFSSGQQQEYCKQVYPVVNPPKCVVKLRPQKSTYNSGDVFNAWIAFDEYALYDWVAVVSKTQSSWIVSEINYDDRERP